MGQPASTAMPELGRKQWRSLRKAVRQLGDDPADEALHKVRIESKRLRYIAEVSGPVLRQGRDRRAAARTVKAATELQNILGELHDSDVSEQWLRDAVCLAPFTAAKAAPARRHRRRGDGRAADGRGPQGSAGKPPSLAGSLAALGRQDGAELDVPVRTGTTLAGLGLAVVMLGVLITAVDTTIVVPASATNRPHPQEPGRAPTRPSR